MLFGTRRGGGLTVDKSHTKPNSLAYYLASLGLEVRAVDKAKANPDSLAYCSTCLRWQLAQACTIGTSAPDQ